MIHFYKLIETKSIREADEYVALGWSLINTYTTCPDIKAPAHQQIHYVLGWSRITDAEYPKNKSTSCQEQS